MIDALTANSGETTGLCTDDLQLVAIRPIVADRTIKKNQLRENQEQKVRILTLEKEAADSKRALLETQNRLAWAEVR